MTQSQAIRVRVFVLVTGFFSGVGNLFEIEDEPTEITGSLVGEKLRTLPPGYFVPQEQLAYKGVTSCMLPALNLIRV